MKAALFDNAGAPCGADPEAWFSDDAIDRLRAVRLCNGCLRKDPCLEQAMEEEAGLGKRRRFGIWGGLTPMQRARLATQRGERTTQEETEHEHD